MPDDLERQLTAFGRTLKVRAGEPIGPGAPAVARTGRRPDRRWWALGGAAACLVAVVTALAVAIRPSVDEPVVAPGTSATEAMTTTTTTTTTTLPPAALDARVGDDPLALVRDGWTLVERATDPFELSSEELPCPTGLDALSGIQQVHDIVTPPDIGGLDVDVQILDVGTIERGTQLADEVLMIGRCISEVEGVEVETTALSSIRATWFRAGPDFVLAAVVGEGTLSIVLEIEGHVFTDFLVADLVHRASQYLAGQEITGAPADTPVATTTVVDVPQTADRVCPSTHVLQGVNTRIEVAERFGLTYQELDAANVDTPGYANFSAGTEIVIPCPTAHSSGSEPPVG